jgi:hypothetical protein
MQNAKLKIQKPGRALAVAGFSASCFYFCIFNF